MFMEETIYKMFFFFEIYRDGIGSLAHWLCQLAYVNFCSGATREVGILNCLSLWISFIEAVVLRNLHLLMIYTK